MADLPGRAAGAPPRFPDAPVLALIVLYFALMLPNLNNSLPYQGDESFYTISALNMIDRGEYLAPFYSGEYRFNKPILTYWVAVAGYALFGASMWSARVPILLLACLTIFTTYRLALFTLGDRRKALLAASLLAASVMFFSFSRIAMTEMVLITFTVPAVFLFAKALAGTGHAVRYAALGSACVGLAFMTKGPVGLLPYAAALVYAALSSRQERRRRLLALANPLNLAIVAAIAMPWYAHVARTYPAAFAGDLGTEARSLGSSPVAGMLGRLLRYGYTVAIFLFPFSLAGAVLLVKRRVRWNPAWAFIGTYSAVHCLTFILFVGEYKSRYLLPIVPMLSIVLADVLFPSGWKVWLKTAGAVLLLQAFFYAVHPLVAHEALRDLTRRWQQGYSAAGSLGVPLETKRAGWCRLFANNRNVVAPEEAGFLIVGEADLQRYPGWPIVATAVQHASLRFSQGKLAVIDNRFHLVARPAAGSRGER